MDKFKNLIEELDVAKVEADKFFLNENMQAGKRYFASLMNITKKCKAARVELTAARAKIRKERNGE